ncbi:MAG: DUF3991 and toprim domain-containing protein [Oscillospiraceae bacterium]|nr:DUF3991 and toprim domain-containing protein [Oscillospiraceae bacterium]
MNSKMSRRRWADKKTLAKAREMDLLTYLQHYEPDELVQLSSNTYTTKTHDSLKISNGKWYWWTQGFGRVSALDYLIEVRKMSLSCAVEQILGQRLYYPRPAPAGRPSPPCNTSPKEFILPRKSKTTHRMAAYLMKRGIDPAIIKHCHDLGLLYESDPYGNAVFVGKDGNGVIRYAASRGENFMGEASGSKKRYSFGVPAATPSGTIQLFESPIDLLSYATLMKLHRRDPWQDDLLSLSGVSKAMQKLPAALERHFERTPNTHTVICRFDNDETGRMAAAAIQELLSVLCPQTSVDVTSRCPPSGADYNEYLCERLKQIKTRRNEVIMR